MINRILVLFSLAPICMGNYRSFTIQNCTNHPLYVRSGIPHSAIHTLGVTESDTFKTDQDCVLIGWISLDGNLQAPFKLLPLYEDALYTIYEEMYDKRETPIAQIHLHPIQGPARGSTVQLDTNEVC